METNSNHCNIPKCFFHNNITDSDSIVTKDEINLLRTLKYKYNHRRRRRRRFGKHRFITVRYINYMCKENFSRKQRLSPSKFILFYRVIYQSRPREWSKDFKLKTMGSSIWYVRTTGEGVQANVTFPIQKCLHKGVEGGGGGVKAFICHVRIKWMTPMLN